MDSETSMEDRKSRALEVLDKILSFLPFETTVSSNDDGENIILNIETSDHQLLIGKRGQTLDALQFLVNRMVGRTHPGIQRIVVDCESYRERRADQLKKMANQVADKVIEEKIPYAFDTTLTAAERRIVHMELREREGVVTRSEGDLDRRRLVVLPGDGDDDE